MSRRHTLTERSDLIGPLSRRVSDDRVTNMSVTAHGR